MARHRGEVRPEMAIAGDDGTLFLTVTGQAFSDKRMTQIYWPHSMRMRLARAMLIYSTKYYNAQQEKGAVCGSSRPGCLRVGPTRKV